MDKRFDLLNSYLTSIFGDFKLEVASSDASFRRYFRVFVEHKSYIVMDAPPDKESVNDFIKIAQLLKGHHINTPEIYFKNQNLGFLVLEDFGNTTLLQNPQTNFYKLAINELVKIQQIPKPCFDEALLRRSKASGLWLNEMELCKQWYNQKFDYQDIFSFLLDNIKNHKQVVVHRDYHSRNLMLNGSKIGVIDFQDALFGSYVYDIASLLRDAYIDLGDITNLQQYYFQQAGLTDFDKFVFDFDMIATQRHLKILGIFKRLSIRDGKDNYLQDLPLVRKYLIDVAHKYPELQSLEELCKQ